MYYRVAKRVYIKLYVQYVWVDIIVLQLYVWHVLHLHACVLANLRLEYMQYC